MDARTAARLYASMELHSYILQGVRRYFSCVQDRQDAKQEAWEKIVRCGPRGCSLTLAKHIAGAAIYAAWKRAYRARKHSE